MGKVFQLFQEKCRKYVTKHLHHLSYTFWNNILLCVLEKSVKMVEPVRFDP